MTEFIKMNGCGNDFVIIDVRSSQINLTKEQINKIAHRKLGIGCDQLILIKGSHNAHCKMVIYNQDGNEAEACGNGARCVAWYMMHQINISRISIETVSAILHAKICNEDKIAINMGKPKTYWRDIPMMMDMDTQNIDLTIDDLTAPSAVNVGNPHVIFFTNNLNEVEIDEIGPVIERHFYFPQRVNVNFAQVIDNHTIILKTFERGVGRTLACGTGACATVFAAINKGLTCEEVLVQQDGGDLDIKLLADGSIEMCGHIEQNFTGRIKF